MELTRWKRAAKPSVEDRLLLAYSQAVAGIIFAEVVVGRGGLRNYPKGSQPRRIDGVRIISSLASDLRPDIITFNRNGNGHEFERLVSGATVEVIEVKPYLDRMVIGQVIVGAELLKMEYKPAIVRQVILCPEGEPLLEEVCTRLNITVWTPDT
jgi:hypothetical protein